LRKSLALAIIVISFLSIVVITPKPVTSLTGWQWEELDYIPIPQVGVAEVYNDEIYFIGENYVQVYSPGNETWWVRKNNGLSGADRCSSAIIYDRIYYHYGWSGFGYYNITLNSFNAVPQPPIERIDVDIEALDNILFVTGGWQSGQIENPETSVEAYCPDNNTWWNVAPNIVGRFNHALENYDGKLYMIGGQINIPENTKVTEVYDPVLNNWSIVAEAPHFMIHCGATKVGSNIVCEALGYTMAYIPTLDKWFDGPSKTWDYGLDRAMVTLNSEAYIVGGRMGNGTPLNDFCRWDGLESIVPSVHIYSPSDNSLVNSTVNVTGKASDNIGVAKVEASLDGISWNLCTGLSDWYVNISLNPGRNRISARATDLVGNTATDTIEVIWDVDIPEIIVTYPPDGANISSDNFNITGFTNDEGGVEIVEYNWPDLSSIWYLAEGNETWQFVSRNSLNGYYVIDIRATDRAGHQNTTRIGFTLDFDAPSIIINNPLDNNIFNKTTVEVNGSTSDNIGVKSVVASLDNTTWIKCNGTVEWRCQFSMETGVNTCNIRAYDFANNSHAENITINIDQENPSVEITSHSDGSNLTIQNITIQGTAADNFKISSVEINLDGTNWMICEGLEDWSCDVTLAQGLNTITVRVTDSVGYTNSTSIDIDYWPVIEEPEDGGGNQGNFLVYILIIIVVVAVVGVIVVKFLIRKK